MSTFAGVRAATGHVRPSHNHGCKPVEVIPGVWTAHFHDIESKDMLNSVSPKFNLVINSATDKCATKAGSYGDGIDVLVVEGLLDDPEARKKVDGMPEGPEKEAAKAALPDFKAEECAGDAKKDFERVNAAIDASKASGGSCMVHCYASLSRSAAFVLAYMMKQKRITLEQAVKEMRDKWDATWPNDTFVQQLLEYEKELGIGVEMKVGNQKGVGFYIRTAKAFLKGIEARGAEEGREAVSAKAPVENLKISGLGESINVAVSVAARMEAASLGRITKLETDYVEMPGGRPCAWIAITMARTA
eukprot:TRINITY_DN50389_c0_g1_i1.p1 TRINITY_DN50389_c0_g1~~TRINITY_DN50389_c0_g1_i1.p1  ORF type:complete len:303 (-),score=61.01 TRINITY_DN50389_c0_g1_i1:162-1070(-)